MIGWSWQDWLPHVEDSIRSGEFEVSDYTDFYVGLFTRMHRAEKAQSGFHVGDTVRIVASDLDGQQGELRVIDPEASEGDFFGVYLDSTQSIQFFCADEIEKVR